jgi:hypothetical protein
MLLFQDAGRGRLLPVKTDSAANLVAHATLADDGGARVVLVNKDLRQEVVATIHVAGQFKVGRLSWLSAPQANAKEGVIYAGAAVRADGSWQPALMTERSPAIRDGRLVVTLPPASAVVLSLVK